MRRSTKLRNVGAAYLAGIVWCIVMMITAFALLDPVLALTAAFDGISAFVATVATMALAMSLATIVAGGLLFLLKRAVVARAEVAERV